MTSSCGGSGGGFKIVNSCDVRNGPISDQQLGCSKDVNVPGFCWCEDETPRFLTPAPCKGGLPPGVKNCDDACAKPMRFPLTAAWATYRSDRKEGKVVFTAKQGQKLKMAMVFMLLLLVAVCVIIALYNSYSSSALDASRVTVLANKMRDVGS